MTRCLHPFSQTTVLIGPALVDVRCTCGAWHIGYRYGFQPGPVDRFPAWADTAYLLAVLTLHKETTV